MGKNPDSKSGDSNKDVEREIRKHRKFSLNEAIGQLAGGDFMKGVESKPPCGKTIIDGSSAQGPAAGTIGCAQAGRPALDFGDAAAERGEPVALAQARPNFDGRNSARDNGLRRMAHG